MAENIVSFCGECGAACCKFGSGVMLTDEEYKELLPLLNNEKRFFENDKVLGIILKFENGKCPLLSEENKCTCYEKRPWDCREFACSHDTRIRGLIEANPQLFSLLEKYAPEQLEAIIGEKILSSE